MSELLGLCRQYLRRRALLLKVGLVIVAILGALIIGRLSAGLQEVEVVKEQVPVTPLADERVSLNTNVSSSTELTTTAVSPIRIVDTRPGSFSYGGSKVPWAATETRKVQVTGLASIPVDAVGVILNITAVNATSNDSFITVFPSGSLRPEASTLNPKMNETSFNAATTLLADGSFDVYNYSGTIDLIIDVTAYMTNNLSEDVSRLRTGERLFPLKPIAGVSYSVDGDNYKDWRNYAFGDPDGFFGAPVEDGRYSSSAVVVMEVAIQPIIRDIKVCFRINSSTDGPVEESEVCADRNTPQSAEGVIFLTSPRVTLPSGKLTVHAKVTTPLDTTCNYTCNAILSYFGFVVFDN